MKRLLCCVGCNEYEELGGLNGAELDAENVFNALVDSEFKSYDSDSRLLRSPTYLDFRVVLQEMLLGEECPDVFTLYFAGHGGVHAGSYYLGLKDTSRRNVAFNGFSLSDLFTLINSSSVSQVFVILDSCNSGGIVYDLNSLLKGEQIGAAGSKSVALLAAAASDQYAMESESGGALTNHIVSILNGRTRISDECEYLDLVEVGRVVSNLFIEARETQLPSSWGVNLYGEGAFTLNPFFSGESSGGDVFEYIPASSSLGKKIALHYAEISKLHSDVEYEVDAEKVATFLSKIKEETFDEERQFVSFLLGILNSLRNQAIRSKELFAESILISGFIPILNRIDESLSARLIPIFAQYRNSAALRELDELSEAIKSDKFFLLDTDSPSGASSQYYCVPIRISKILGWLGVLLYESKYLGLEDDVKFKVTSLLADIVDDYPMAFCAVSESQAVHVFMGIMALLDRGCGAQACYIYLNYLESIGSNKGQVCSIEASGEDILTFISLYGSPALKSVPKIVASPTCFLFAILLLARSFGLEEELDSMMHVFDRKTIYSYVSNDHREFGDIRMRDGVNLSLQVGFSFWSMDEFYKLVFDVLETKFEKDQELKLPDIQYVSTVSSFVFEDRIPLFL